MPWYFSQYLPQLHEAADRAPTIFNQRPWELEIAADDRWSSTRCRTTPSSTPG